jgi:hypothetical protein
MLRRTERDGPARLVLRRAGTPTAQALDDLGGSDACGDGAFGGDRSGRGRKRHAAIEQQRHGGTGSGGLIDVGYSTA